MPTKMRWKRGWRYYVECYENVLAMHVPGQLDTGYRLDVMRFSSLALGVLLVTCVPVLRTTASSMDRSYFENHYVDPPPAPPKHTEDGRNALRLEYYKWPNGVVPYIISEGFSAQEQAAILEAMNVLQQQTCVYFIPKTADQREHIRFVRSQWGCGSAIGFRRGQSEPLDVTLDTFCLELSGAIQHELLHVLGLFHEHTRPDRDEYVEVFWDNIEPEFQQNFVKGSWEYMETFGLPYDYGSLMHYPSFAFAKAGTSVTMVSRWNSSYPLGQTDGASFYDIQKVRYMYPCP
ncbi:zinc metalloproteinase nas-14 [Anopheles darlingi]|uniref:Metalloendopeptidase n=1 Tax=Anopheles darlingi TaxID=43151 RepID=W5JA86_ANODA|nr:zinc metalloproteinase nas-14 [Anopheles darlingi]